MKYLLLFFFLFLLAGNLPSDASQKWKKGILTDEFIFTSAPYPSCHAATIAETPAGLAAAWFGGTRERHPDVGIWVSLHRNGKWSEAKEVANGIASDTLRFPTWNPVLYQVPGGKLMLFYKTGPGPSSWKGMLTESADDGLTWSKPAPLPEGFIGPVKNKPVLLPSGELFCPSSTEGNGWKVHFEVTPDFGKTWKKTGPVEGNSIDAIQPSILLHAGSRLQILCRSRSRAIAESWSTDGGLTWSPLAITTLPNNNSGTDAVTLSDGRQLLVYNHVLPPGNDVKGPRTPLNLSVSKDGKHWYAALVLEDSPISQYSYPSVIQTSDGLVHVVYTWRRERIKHVVIDPAKLELKKIKGSSWPDKEGYKIAVCDWMILKRQKPGAVKLASEIGADGVEVDMGGLGDRPTFDNKLTDPVFRNQYDSLLQNYNIRISSIAMSGFYAQSFAEREGVEQMIADCIHTMNLLGIKVAFLPLGVQGDLVKYPEKRSAIVNRLKMAGKMAGEAGVVIGIETALDAAGEVKLLEEIGSPAIKIYFNFANPLEAGRDLYQELNILGKDRICQIHATDKDGVWLQNNTRLDMKKVRKTLDRMGWKGWLVLERSRDASDPANVIRNFRANTEYMKSIFQ